MPTSWQLGLAVVACTVAFGGPLWFFLFWHWFEFWRRRRVLAYSVFAGTLVGVAVVTIAAKRWVFAGRVNPPLWVAVIGWALFAVVSVFGAVADRQIGVRVRSFMPFFDARGHIRLQTTGAYGVVRHPIYAAGIGWEVAVLLLTGYPAMAVAVVTWTVGALWFTGQEERRLIGLLDDPTEYDLYRERVPALFPRLKKSSRLT